MQEQEEKHLPVHTLGLPAPTLFAAKQSQGQLAFSKVGPSGPFIVKHSDLHCARGCHIRSFGLSDLFPSNTAALWFLSDKCGSLGLTKMNVLVYESQLSTILMDPTDLDLKPGIDRVNSPKHLLKYRL